jgi:UDP-3-O-[3-hydroxymyristoyl] glucosamine N-acyltransferase
VTLGNHVKVGRNCLIHANVSVYDHCVIGDNVVIHANTVIGADAFYYQKRAGRYVQFTSCGRVVIADDVHIGANCTIDRGVTGDTYIGEGTRIDNLVHIGHDTRVGRNCLFASQVGLAGCVVVEDRVTLWGQVGCISDVVLGEGCVVYAQSGISKDLAPGKTYFGSPAEEIKKKYREIAALKRLAAGK